MTGSQSTGTDTQHVLVPLVTYAGGVTEYRCQKCDLTGMDGIQGPCRGGQR